MSKAVTPPASSPPAGGFLKLIRSISRRRNGPKTPDESYSRFSPSLATSPPPDSYFPPPPPEPSQTQRPRELRRGRGNDTNESTSNRHVVENEEEPGSNWNPSVRRTQSSRVAKTQGPSAASFSRGRAGSESVQVASYPNVESSDAYEELSGKGTGTRVITFGVGEREERRGVQLTDTPLRRKGSIKKAIESVGFVQTAKVAGQTRCLLMVADGNEEIEVFTVLDLLVRASLNPIIVSISPSFSPSQSLPWITLSRGARILADVPFESLSAEVRDDFDAVICCGGAKGAERLAGSKDLLRLVKRYHFDGKLVGCIDTGSLVAKAAEIGQGGRITSHPTAKGDLENHYDFREDRVVISHNLITSRGPGTSIEFALALIEFLAGGKKRVEVEGPLIC